jgi:hypothetical protein
VPPSVRTYQVVPGPVGCCAATTIEVAADFVWAGLLLSVTITVKLDVPVTDGVPEITPVVADMVNPAGRLPDGMDHVYAGVPPLTCRPAE